MSIPPSENHTLFTLSPHSVLPVSHLSLSPLLLALIPLSIALCHFWKALILMHLARGLSSKLIIPSCVRPSVPLLGEAQNPCFCTILSEISENHLCILRYLADVALKAHHKICLLYTSPSPRDRQKSRMPSSA